MSKKNVLLRKIKVVVILMLLFTTIAGIQAVASTKSQGGKINWKSNTKDKEIQVPDGVSGDNGQWESSTYTPADEGSNSTSSETQPMSTAAEYGAIAAGLLGVLAINAAKNPSNSNSMTVASGNGIWVPECDRNAVIKMINDAASKQYYIDANGFIKAVPGAVEDSNKSSTYSSIIDRLINGNNKVVIGVDNGWVSYGKNGLQGNTFSGDNSGITIGDNGTPQVVIVNGQDTADSPADITLAHELTHALRGELGIKSMDPTGGVNKDEEANTIEVEDQIRKELGYDVRTDGDSSDGGDGSYGQFSDAAEEEDWYNNIDNIKGSTTLSGNAYSYDDYTWGYDSYDSYDYNNYDTWDNYSYDDDTWNYDSYDSYDYDSYDTWDNYSYDDDTWNYDSYDSYDYDSYDDTWNYDSYDSYDYNNYDTWDNYSYDDDTWNYDSYDSYDYDSYDTWDNYSYDDDTWNYDSYDSYDYDSYDTWDNYSYDDAWNYNSYDSYDYDSYDDTWNYDSYDSYDYNNYDTWDNYSYDDTWNYNNCDSYDYDSYDNTLDNYGYEGYNDEVGAYTSEEGVEEDYASEGLLTVALAAGFYALGAGAVIGGAIESGVAAIESGIAAIGSGLAMISTAISGIFGNFIEKDSEELDEELGAFSGEASNTGSTIDYVKLSEELGTKIETDSYKVINTETAEQANADWADMGFNLPPVAENTTVYNVEAGDFSYSRVYLEGYNRPVSSFILRTEDIEGLSAEEIAQKYALSKVPDKIVTVELPSDTPLEVSIVGPQESWGTLGGDVQYAIKDADLNPSWFENIQDLK